MKRTLTLLTTLLLAPLAALHAADTGVPVEAKSHLVSKIGSERATQGIGNMMVTWGNRTHVVWQDSPAPGAYSNRVRTFDRTTGQWSPVYTLLDAAKDNHARPVITVDGRGFLHVVMGGHHSAVRYLRSTRPNDASQWEPAEEVGIGTYPMLVCAPDGTLHLTLRKDSKWDGVNHFVRPQDGKWELRAQLVKRSYGVGYAGYKNVFAWGPGRTLHFACSFYEGKDNTTKRGQHQAIAYMRSADGGSTWTRNDGSAISLPAKVSAMDVIVSDIGLRPEPWPVAIFSAPNMIVSADGRPQILFVSHLTKSGEVILATLDEHGAWQKRSLDALERAFPDGRPIAPEPGAFTVTANGDQFALFTLAPLVPAKGWFKKSPDLRPQEQRDLVLSAAPNGWIKGQPTRALSMATFPGRPVAWLISRDGGRTFVCERAVPPDPNASYAILQVEKATGHNTPPASGGYPDLLYFDGSADYPEPGKVIQNNVFLLQRH